MDKKEKTLFVTDLDGTLLTSKNNLSEYTIETLNNLINKGMTFSYATARSLSSASVVTNGLKLNNPVVIYNGTFIVNPNTKEKVYSLCFSQREKEIVKNVLAKHNIFPLVYSNIKGVEKVSWIESMENNGIKNYKDSRKGDNRLRPIETMEQLYQGDIFYYTCIADKKEDLQNIYEYFMEKPEFNCTIQKELYKEEYWCEIMLKKSTKGNAILELKGMLKCDKIVSFGDAINDISMFKISDQSYAVENAPEELKKYANGIIPSNDQNGVAQWLEKNYIQ